MRNFSCEFRFRYFSMWDFLNTAKSIIRKFSIEAKPCNDITLDNPRYTNPIEVSLSLVSATALSRVNPYDLWIIIANANCSRNCFLMEFTSPTFENFVAGGTGTQLLFSLPFRTNQYYFWHLIRRTIIFLICNIFNINQSSINQSFFNRQMNDKIKLIKLNMAQVHPKLPSQSAIYEVADFAFEQLYNWNISDRLS